MSSNRRPHTSIPNLPWEAQQPAVPSFSTPIPSSEYSVHVLPPNPYMIGEDMASASWNPFPLPPPPRQQATPMNLNPLPPRPRVQSVSEHYPTTTTPIVFPEPQFHRATSYRDNLSVPPRSLTHHRSGSNLSHNSNLSNVRPLHTNPSVASFASSYAEGDYHDLGSNEVRSSISFLLYLP